MTQYCLPWTELRQTVHIHPGAHFFCPQTEQKSINELQPVYWDLEGFAGTSDFVPPLILSFLDLSPHVMLCCGFIEVKSSQLWVRFRIVYGCQGGQKWRSGTNRQTLRKALSSPLWRPIGCSSENPVQQLGLLKMPQSHSISVPHASSYFAAFGSRFFQHHYAVSSYAALEVQCPTTAPPAEAWARLLGHQQPFLGTRGFRNDGNRLPHGSCLKEQWRISYIWHGCFGCPWCEINGDQEPNCEYR